MNDECRIEDCHESRTNRLPYYCKRHATKWRLYQTRGFSLDQFEMVIYTENCEVCGDHLVTPNIDHDHSHCGPKKWCIECFRGVVCVKCNQLLSHFDRPGILKAARNYLDLYDSRKAERKVVQSYKQPTTRDNVGRFVSRLAESETD